MLSNRFFTPQANVKSGSVRNILEGMSSIEDEQKIQPLIYAGRGVCYRPTVQLTVSDIISNHMASDCGVEMIHAPD
jgi:hypothetical protein